MNRRRDPFETSEQTSLTPPAVYDTLRVAGPRKRNRQWEKRTPESQGGVSRRGSKTGAEGQGDRRRSGSCRKGKWRGQ